MKLRILLAAAVVIAVVACKSENVFEPPPASPPTDQPSTKSIWVEGQLAIKDGHLMLEGSRGQWPGQDFELVGALVDELRQYVPAQCLVFGTLTLVNKQIEVLEYTLLVDEIS